MPENNVINNEMIETATTTVTEVAKKADKTGLIFMGLGFAGGIGIVAGCYVLKTKITKKRAEKAAEKFKKTESAEE